MVTRWIGRWKKQILCIFGSWMVFLASVYGEMAGSSLSRGYLERRGYGEDGRSYEIIADGIYEEPVRCTVEISPVQYSEEQASQVMETLLLQLPEMILGQNEAADHIQSDLNLMNSFEDTGIRAVWKSRNPDIIDSFGRITAENVREEGSEVMLSVVLTDGVYEKEGEIELKVYPYFQSETEKLAEHLKELIRQADKEHPTDRQVMLPLEYNGKQIRYRDGESSDYLALPLLGIMLAVLLYGQEKAGEQENEKQRQQMLLLDYADVVYQLMVYIGAGLTVKKAWECIVQNYEKRREMHLVHTRPAYEEMAVTLNQIYYGEPEGKAIDGFGRRCRLQPYVKLCSLLEQNRKTGTKNLKQILEQEMTAAWEEQKHTARRMGEEARTRLLAPLFLLLLVVMVIIMVPALMALQ